MNLDLTAALALCESGRIGFSLVWRADPNCDGARWVATFYSMGAPAIWDREAEGVTAQQAVDAAVAMWKATTEA